nr:site-specific integrase [uncultured Desulfobacter sp.]
MSKRFKTKYPGVYYRESKRIGGVGIEKVYYIVFKKDGKVIEEKVGRQYVDDLTPAKVGKIRAERIEGKRLSRKALREQAEAKKAEKDGKYTIDKLWREYSLNRHPGKGLDVDTNRYQNYIQPIFGDKEPRELVKLDVDRVRINLLKKKSPQTVKHILNLFTWIINYGVKNNLCAGVSFHIQKPTVNNEKTEDLSPEQLSNLLSAIEADPSTAVGNMMKMALYSGMRRGELFNLKWDDVNFDTGFIWIRDPKGGKDQKIPMNDMARGILESIPRTKSPYVFFGKDGKKRVTLGRIGKRIREAAGLPKDFRPMHGLRHTYASMLASSGQVDMYVLQKLMTHKSPSMTQRYAHLRDDALKNGAGQIDDIFKKQAEGTQEKKIVNIQNKK